MVKFAKRNLKSLVIVISGIGILIVGLFGFYKAPVLVNSVGELIRRPFDVISEQTSKVINGDENWKPSRIVYNNQSTVKGEDWPYYFYAKVLEAGQPYYGDLDYPAGNEWFLVVEDYSGEEIVVHAMFGSVVEGVDHPVVGQENSLGFLTDIENMFKVGDVVKIYIDKPSIKEAMYDSKIIPEAIFVEARQ